LELLLDDQDRLIIADITPNPNIQKDIEEISYIGHDLADALKQLVVD